MNLINLKLQTYWISMTVAGNSIIENCRKCYVDNGFGVRLEPRGNEYVCKYCNSRYTVENGLMKGL